MVHETENWKLSKIIWQIGWIQIVYHLKCTSTEIFPEVYIVTQYGQNTREISGKLYETCKIIEVRKVANMQLKMSKYNKQCQNF